METSVSAPLASALLSDFGAEVIKVENPRKGDVSRGWDAYANGLSATFVYLNRNKKSIALDLKSKQDRAILYKIIKKSDVFIHNQLPSSATQLGLSYQKVSRLNPKIIYCEISGYGRGPYQNKRAYDLLMQGETGVLLLNGYPDMPAKIPLSVCDISAALNAALSILMAIMFRSKYGEGQKIEISMFDSILSWVLYYPWKIWYDKSEPERTGLKHGHIIPYGVFPCKDGRYINLAIAAEKDWVTLCNALGINELLKRKDLQSNEGRLRRKDFVERKIEEALSKYSQREVIKIFDKNGIPYGSVNELSEVLEGELARMHKLVNYVDSSVGPIKTIHNFIKMSKCKMKLGRVPDLGENKEQILRELGI